MKYEVCYAILFQTITFLIVCFSTCLAILQSHFGQLETLFAVNYGLSWQFMFHFLLQGIFLSILRALTVDDAETCVIGPRLIGASAKYAM